MEIKTHYPLHLVLHHLLRLQYFFAHSSPGEIFQQVRDRLQMYHDAKKVKVTRGSKMASNMMEKKNEHLADVTLHSLCTTLSKKFDGIKKDNKQLISEDLRDLSRLLFYGAKAESLHESFAINMLQFLRHVLSFSDVRCLQNGINFKNKLLILLSLKLMYISRQDSMILSDFKGKYFFQFLFHTALRTVNINANFVKNVVFQGISGFDKSSGIPKVSVLLLSPVLCCIESWDCECAGEISQKICQWLLLHWKQVASVPGKKSLFNARNLPMVIL